MYMNGKLIGEKEWIGKISIFAAPTGAIVLGRDNEDDFQYLRGFIDEFAFFTRALSEDEINFHMNNGVLSPVDPEKTLASAWEIIKEE